jgi:hypothetical protein
MFEERNLQPNGHGWFLLNQYAVWTPLKNESLFQVEASHTAQATILTLA